MLLVHFVLSSCSSCSSTENKHSHIGNDELKHIQFKLNIVPSKYNVLDHNHLNGQNLFLFYLDDKYPDYSDLRPFTFEVEYGKRCSIADVNKDSIFDDYSGTFVQDKDDNGYNMLSGSTSYIFFLRHCTRIKKGKYLVVIETIGSIFYKIMTINGTDKNKQCAEYQFDLIQKDDVNGTPIKYIEFQ